MSDPRDPALEAAIQQYADFTVKLPAVHGDAVRFGYDAAFRSLGAGTPEAQAALREVIRTTLAAERLPIPSVEGMSEDAAYQAVKAWSIDWQMLLKSNRKALRDFARLATPTEEAE